MIFAIEAAVFFVIAAAGICWFLAHQENPRGAWGFTLLLITVGLLALQNIINTHNVQALMRLHEQELREQLQKETTESTAPLKDPLLE